MNIGDKVRLAGNQILRFEGYITDIKPTEGDPLYGVQWSMNPQDKAWFNANALELVEAAPDQGA